jgi:hypothetical protein
MSTDTTADESRTLLRDVTWQQYVSVRDSDEYRHTRMTFDRVSQALPGFPCEQLTELIKRRTTAGETSLIRQFRAACQAIRG